MLLSFGVENYKSLRDWQEISLVSSRQQKDDESGLIDCEQSPSGSVVPFALLWGANAAGKSTLLDALDFMRGAVKNSYVLGPEAIIPREGFQLDESWHDKPTTCEAEFTREGRRYQYGFSVTRERVVEEWLFHYPNGRRAKLFERTKDEIVFGRGLGSKSRLNLIKEAVRPNALVLSTAANLNHSMLDSIAQFLRDVVVDNSQTELAGRGIHLIGHDEDGDLPIDHRAIILLKALNTGVVDWRLEDLNVRDFALQLGVSGSRLPKSIAKIQLAHVPVDGQLVWFEMNQESSGTRRLVHMLSDVFRALDGGTLCLIDELSASLHTGAAAMILALFNDRRVNKKGAQLLATTHSLALWQRAFVRRDQVWFVEKDEIGQSIIYPLTDFKTRKGDNYPQAYFDGRYGAVPFLGDPRMFIGTADQGGLMGATANE